MLTTQITASTTELVRAAAEGDERAWDLVVQRYNGRVWSAVRMHSLDDRDAADVVATIWLQLAQELHELREPEAVGAWLAATARTESLRALRLLDCAKCSQPEVRSRTEGATALASQGASSAHSRRLWKRGATPRGEMQARPNAAVLPGGCTKDEPEAQAVAAERDLMLLECMDELPERDQALLRALLVDPPLCDEEISSTLSVPINSIGPARARCLRRLRQRMERFEPAGSR